MSELRSAEHYPLGAGKVQWTCTDWLEENLGGDFLLLDCQPNIHDYIQEHIPGAVYFNPDLLRVPYLGVPGKYIPEDAVDELFERVGLRNDVPVVVYTGTGAFKGWGDGLEQTMVAYSLVRFGHQEVWLLDGGLDSWKHEGRELSQTYPDIRESDFDVEVQEDLFVTYEQFKEIKDNDDVIVLDARPASAYEGQGPWRKPGHIPGAVNVPWKSFMHPDNARLLRTDDEIRAILDEHGITEDNTVVCSCGTGREATNEFLLFTYYLQFPSVKIYEGSFTEWVHMDEPTVTGPDPR
ncbi:MAG: sulfurtransferase [Armatimonadota bacterium]